MTADGMIEVTLRVSGVSRTQLIDPDVDAVWISEQDPHLNPMGAKGIGEIGIVGPPPPSATPSTTRPAAASGICPSPRQASPVTAPPPSFTSDSTPAKLDQ